VQLVFRFKRGLARIIIRLERIDTVNISKYAGLIIIVPLLMWTDSQYGPIGGTRLWGIFTCLFAVCFCFVPEVPISFGNVEVFRFKGWWKAFVIIPTATLGILVVIYAAPITCSATKHRHLCT
jgi:hypothetical protein